MTDETDLPNLTLRLLRELREHMDRRFDLVEREIEGLHAGLSELRLEMNQRFDATNGILSGEMAKSAFAFKGVEERFAEHDRRLHALELARPRS